METSLVSKKEIRKIISSLKKEMTENSIATISDEIFAKLYKIDEFINSDRIYTYVNYNQEINTKALILRMLSEDKTVCVPKVMGDDLYFYEIKSLHDLKPGAYGILEPDTDVCSIDAIHSGIMIMPGLAFDRTFTRIGYGRGYYDRYLAKHPGFTKIALCFDYQIIDFVPYDEYDVKMDYIISEKNYFKRSM